MNGLLHRLMISTANLVAQDFLDKSVEVLSLELDALHVFITRKSSTVDHAVDVLSSFRRGRHTRLFSFSLSGTPCERIYADTRENLSAPGIHAGVVAIEDGVAELFDGASDSGAQSFVGIPLWDQSTLIGHYSIFFERSLADQCISSECIEVCRIFGMRIESELQRLFSDIARSRLLRSLEISNRKLFVESRYDPLTHCLNRQALFSSLSSFGAEDGCLIALSDLDHFKSINDHYGHDLGDVVLKYFSLRLKKAFKRGDDMVFRLGGEEFAVLVELPRLSGPEMLEAILLRTSRFSVDVAEGDAICVSASWGIASYGGSWEEAYRNADQSLYQAKEQGRDRVVSWETTLNCS